MAPVTNFAVKDGYQYLEGFGSYHSCEAFPDAIPIANNTPQKPAYGLRTERISGTSFTAPRSESLQTWLYRTNSSLHHGEFVEVKGQKLEEATHWTPNSYMWASITLDVGGDWISSQRLMGRNGDPMKKQGCAVYLFSLEKDMAERTAFSSLDGDCLILPQAGALDIQTDLLSV